MLIYSLMKSLPAAPQAMFLILKLLHFLVLCKCNACSFHDGEASSRRVGGGSRGSNEPPLEVKNGGLKTKTVDFQLLANSGGMENKL